YSICYRFILKSDGCRLWSAAFFAALVSSIQSGEERRTPKIDRGLLLMQPCMAPLKANAFGDTLEKVNSCPSSSSRRMHYVLTSSLLDQGVLAHFAVIGSDERG